MKLLNCKSYYDLTKAYQKWITASLKAKVYDRDSRWTQSVAICSRNIVERIKRELGSIARGRRIRKSTGDYHELKETLVPYGNSVHQEQQINTLRWDILTGAMAK